MLGHIHPLSHNEPLPQNRDQGGKKIAYAGFLPFVPRRRWPSTLLEHDASVAWMVWDWMTVIPGEGA
jgi:hypothetical protein